MPGKLSYAELISIPTFQERYEYAKLAGKVGEDTFGFDRYLNQMLYRSAEWKQLRNRIIVRDEGQDLAFPGLIIPRTIIIHHMNPITVDQVKMNDPDLFNPDYLVCVSPQTHRAIHYGNSESSEYIVNRYNPVTRTAGDTKLW